eukprot:11764386-Alexandrium_andersonii.AAC.1
MLWGTIEDMRPLDAQTLLRTNGAMLAEEVAAVLGTRITAISSRMRPRTPEGEPAREAPGGVPVHTW